MQPSLQVYVLNKGRVIRIFMFLFSFFIFHFLCKLCYTKKSGYYAIPLTSVKQAINNIDRENNSAIALTIKNINGQSKQTIALDH